MGLEELRQRVQQASLQSSGSGTGRSYLRTGRSYHHWQELSPHQPHVLMSGHSVNTSGHSVHLCKRLTSIFTGIAKCTGRHDLDSHSLLSSHRQLAAPSMGLASTIAQADHNVKISFV